MIWSCGLLLPAYRDLFGLLASEEKMVPKVGGKVQVEWHHLSVGGWDQAVLTSVQDMHSDL